MIKLQIWKRRESQPTATNGLAGAPPYVEGLVCEAPFFYYAGVKDGKAGHV